MSCPGVDDLVGGIALLSADLRLQVLGWHPWNESILAFVRCWADSCMLLWLFVFFMIVYVSFIVSCRTQTNEAAMRTTPSWTPAKQRRRHVMPLQGRAGGATTFWLTVSSTSLDFELSHNFCQAKLWCWTCVQYNVDVFPDVDTSSHRCEARCFFGSDCYQEWWKILRLLVYDCVKSPLVHL